jgi:hypothetical protein
MARIASWSGTATQEMVNNIQSNNDINVRIILILTNIYYAKENNCVDEKRKKHNNSAFTVPLIVSATRVGRVFRGTSKQRMKDPRQFDKE